MDKYCTKCQQTLPLSQFSKNCTTKDGFQKWCKQCLAKVARERQQRIAQQDREIPTSKMCPRCKLHKRGSEFPRNRTTLDGLWGVCKACTRDQYLQRKYGINEEEYQKLRSTQEDRCAICRRDAAHTDKPLVVDHCHKQSKIRELLCDACNKGLGCFEDDSEVLMNAIDYLRRHS